MKKSLNVWTKTLGAAALLAASVPAYAGVSIDRISPSIGGCPFVVTPAHVYLQVPPGGGCDVGGAGPQVEVRPPSFGLVAADNIDALSANTWTSPALAYHLVFSGDRPSQGQPGTPYRNQAVRNQAASDLWRTPLSAASPAWSMGACAVVAIPPPQAQHRNQTDFNLIFTAAPPVFAPGGIQDNIDAVELDVLDITGDQFHDFDTYFSLDAASPSLGGATPASIFFSPIGGATAVFSGPGPLGLVAGDNIDALVMWDRNIIGVRDPGMDLVLFSLAPGSPSLGGASPADIFVSTFGGGFCRFTTANQLGMLPTDNVDGLDVIP
jgi:hypothetical protein